MQEIDLATQTMFAELLQRSLDAEFDAEFRENGTFIRKRSKGRLRLAPSSGAKAPRRPTSTSVPVTDQSITDRVNAVCGRASPSFKRRQTLVRALAAAGLPTPDPLSGAIVEAMWKAALLPPARGACRHRWLSRPMPARSASASAAAR